ncbi:alpha/beta hydrolase family protein [Methylobacterium sp. A54F]
MDSLILSSGPSSNSRGDAARAAPVTIEAFGARGKDTGDTPTVFLLHDAGGCGPAQPIRGEAAALAEAGFRVLMPHYLERTGADRAGFSEIARDFSAWAEALREAIGPARPAPLALVGRSLGGALALALAGEAPGLAALVLRAAFLPPCLGAGPLTLPPVLACHGGRDAIVPAAQAHRLAERIGAAGGACRLVLYADQAHAFDAATDADALARTIAFLREHMPDR